MFNSRLPLFFFGCLLSAGATSLAGCDVEPVDSQADPMLERMPIGKADAAGSCEDRCGFFDADESCQCDAGCEQYGDCCDNRAEVCADEPVECDPTLVCSQAITCVDSFLYPTGCGPANCDEPIGPCFGGPAIDFPVECDPTLVCSQAITCVDGMQYPTGCGPDNCDEPLGPCFGGPVACDPTLVCTQAITCVDGMQYPTGCGPDNCDEPLGPC